MDAGTAQTYLRTCLSARVGSAIAPPSFLLEIKGYESDNDKMKHGAAKRWVSAVNNWGQMGKWEFHVCRSPQMLGQELQTFV